MPKTALYEWNEILSRIFPSLSLVERGLEGISVRLHRGTGALLAGAGAALARAGASLRETGQHLHKRVACL